ncbi:uncharacterized protein PRCAT00001572001 [Priceomyces carsonii]|uniref:uncharacterized protein n=1 Tax=Priceomyces carsonii TaxID=28549 RepID=UPI002ED936EE|nr:unnamed protein product [Priceomyces carsonii]
MSPPMKGLTQFIVDLRNSKDLEEENKRINLEINNIQTKFSTNLNGYQKKKYICKLIYIYLLGYTDVAELGMRGAIELLESLNYAEKQLGYLAISIFCSIKQHQSAKDHLLNLMDKVHIFLRNDLRVENDNVNCLAIQFICSTFNVPDESILHIDEHDDESGNWLELVLLIYSFCTSPMQSSMVRKKSTLALFTLLKLYPHAIVQHDNWIPRLLTLIDDSDYGVVISCIPLMRFIVTLQPQFIRSIMASISNKLYALVVDQKCPDQYYYYETPAPWLVIELLQLVEYCFLLANDHTSFFLSSDLDSQSLSNLRQVVAKSIQSSSRPIKGLPNRNTQSSILFQSVSLAVFIDPSPDAMSGAMHALVLLLNSNETNTRYLSLDALIKLSARQISKHPMTSNTFDEDLPKIFLLLHDKDISVRRKALDILYIICDQKSYSSILNKLLDYFPLADYGLRSEIAVKIAILAERFATDSTSYVTTMLKLLSIGGSSNSNGMNYIGNEVWERIVQIIVNNEDLQKKSCKFIISLLKNPEPSDFNGKRNSVSGELSENLVKVAAFVLGEFGHLVNDSFDTSVKVQFLLLYRAYFRVSLLTRAMLLSSFLKYAIKSSDEEFIPDIIDLFDVESKSIDLEIQTRSHEYLQLATHFSNSNVGKRAVAALPVFEKKESPLMNRIGNIRKLTSRSRSGSFVNILKIRRSNTISKSNLRSGSNLTLPIAEEGDKELNETSNDINPFEDDPSNINPDATLSPNWYAGYHRILHFDAGIFFDDQLVKITYRVLKEKDVLTYKFSIINNSLKTLGTIITGLNLLKVKNMSNSDNPSYTLTVKKMPDSTVDDKTTMEVSAKVRDVIENDQSPILSISFKCGGTFVQLNLKFPVLLLKTLSSSKSNLEDFKKRWLQIGDLLGAEGEFSTDVSTRHGYLSSNISRLMVRLGYSVVHSSPDDNDNILVMGAGIIHTQKCDYGLLTTIQGIDASVKRFRIVVRCTGGGIATVIAETLKEIFEGRF